MCQWGDSGEVDDMGFRAALSGLTPRVDMEAPEAPSFRGRVRFARLDEVTVLDLTTSGPYTVTRSPEEAARRPGDTTKVILMVEGAATITQDGRAAELGPGDFAVEDTARPYRATFTGLTRQRVVMFPTRFLELPPSILARVTATRFSPEDGVGRALGPVLAELGATLVELDDPHARRFARATVDLLVTALSAQAYRMLPTRADSRVPEILDWIEEHLGDPDLTPATVAAAHHMSVRNLHAVFSHEQTTVAARIRTRRLERIRRDLADPLLVDQSISAIAARHGMTNAAHLSRLFKAATGCSPSEYRAQCTQAA